MTFSIFESSFSIISEDFSSGQANFTKIDFNPNAISSSSNERFLAPCSSRIDLAFSLICSISASGELGRIFVITATIDMHMIKNYAF